MAKKPFIPPSDAIVEKPFIPPDDAIIDNAPVEKKKEEEPTNDTGNPIVSALVGLGKSAWNVLTNQIPQEFKTEDLRNSKGTLASYINPSQRDGDANVRISGFEFPEGDDLRAQYTRWVFKQPDGVRTLDNEKRSEIFLKEKLGDKGYKNLLTKFTTQLTDYRSSLEEGIQSQKSESNDLLEGIPQSYKDVKNVDELGKYVGQLAGQGVGRILTSVGTAGAGSVIAERSAVYDRQLDQMAEVVSKKSGIPLEDARQKIIQLEKDNPEAGQTIADFAALLDIASIPILGTGKILGKVVPLLIEGTTEAIQSELEEKGATQGSGTPYKYDPTRTIDSFLGGVIGVGVVQSVLSTKEEKIDKVIDNVADTGNPEVNAQIDEGATLTTQEKQQLNQKQNEQESKTRNGSTVQSGGEISSEVGGTEPSSGSSSSGNQEVRSEENGIVGQKGEEVNAIQEPSTSSLLQQEQEEVGSQGSERSGVEQGEQGKETPEASKEKISFEQTPAYIDADVKVRDIANQIRQNPDNYGELLPQLNAAIQERDNARMAAEEKAKQKAKQESIVITNPAAALKQQIKQHYQNVKEGVIKGVKGVNDLIQKIRDVAKEHKLTSAQTNALLGKVQKSNLFTPGSVSNLNSFVDKVAEDADYAEKLQQAKNLRKTVSKKGKSTLRDFREKELTRVFKQINPEEVDNIDEYNAIGQSLAEGFKPNQIVNLESSHKSVKDIVSKMYRNEFKVSPAEAYTSQDMLDQLTQRKEEARTNDHIEQLANELGVDFDEAAAIYNEEEKGGNPQKLRDKLLEIAKDKKIENTDYVGIRKNIVDAINSIDPEQLSAAQLKRFIAVIDRINENDSFSEAGPLAALAKAQEGWRKVKEKIQDFKVLNLNWIESNLTDSLPLAIQAIFGLKKSAALFQHYSGISGVSTVRHWAANAKNDLINLLNDIHVRQKESGFNDESVDRQGIYGELISYPEGSNPNESLEEKKKLIEEMIDTYATSGNSKDATKLRQLYAPFKSAKTIEEVQSIMGKVDPGGKKAIHSIIDFYSNHKISAEDPRTILEALTDDNELFHNKDTEVLVNYSGRRIWRTVTQLVNKDVDVQDLDQIITNNPTKPKQLSSGFEKRNAYQKGKVIDLNVHLNAINQIERDIYDIASKPYRLQVREFANDRGSLRELLGGSELESKSDRSNLSEEELSKLNTQEKNRKLAEKLIGQMFDGKNSLYHSFERASLGQVDNQLNKIEKGILKGVSIVKSLGYGLTLSGLTQIIKQPVVLINTGIQTGMRASVIKRLVEMTANPTGAQKFFSQTDVGHRGESHALLNAGDTIDRAALRSTKNQLRLSLPKYLQSRFDGALGWFSGITPLLFADVRSAKPSYMAFYEQYLDEHGEKYLGLDKENELRNEEVRQEARAYAEHSVDILQGVSNPSKQGEAFRNSKLLAGITRSFLAPYGNFSANAKARLYADYAALLNGNSAQKIEAAKDIMATYSETVGFAATSIATRGAMLYIVGNIVRSMVGLPDKDDWDKWWELQKKILTKEIIYGVIPAILTAPGEQGLGNLINWALYGMHNMDEEPLTKNEWEKKYSPLPKQQGDRPFYEYLGAHGAVFSGVAKAYEFTSKTNDEELIDEQRRLALTVAWAQYGQLVGVIPADVNNAIKSTFYNQTGKATLEPTNRNRIYRPTRSIPRLPR